MQIFIPPLGTKIVLTEPWLFSLYHEYRNLKLLDLFRIDMGSVWARPIPSTLATLPTNTILTIDRIYIRQGQKDFDSVTFWAKLPNSKKKSGIRFWAKLSDVNRIKCELETSEVINVDASEVCGDQLKA